ncbi:hypothetical protein HK405_008195, partial [Cladochytrium tenue]
NGGGHLRRLDAAAQQAVWSDLMFPLTNHAHMAGFDTEIMKGLRFVEITPDRHIILEIKVGNYARNPMDNAHGGWIATVVDAATAMSKHLLAYEDGHPNAPEVSASINTTYVSAAPVGCTLIVDSFIPKIGRQLAFVDCVICRKNEDGSRGAVVATGTHILFLFGQLSPTAKVMDLRHFNSLPREEQQAIWHSIIDMLAFEELAGFDIELYKDLKFIEITDDRRVIMELLVRPYARNPMDNAHGGWIATAVDLVTTMAKQILALADGKPLVTDVSVSISTTYVSAAPVGCTLIFENTVPKVGAQLAFLACKIYRKNDDGSKGPVVATGTHIKYRVPSKL